MAGNVTGNLGSENITLRNIATEDTLSDILEVLKTKSITDSDTPENTKKKKENTKATDQATNAIKKGSNAFGDFVSKFGQGAIKIVRNLDTEIENISFTFSSMARGSGTMSKTFQYAATSVAQLQEQFNAYSKMMQVGGVAANDFMTLKETATGLGTNLTGLTRITEQYTTSLKVGSSTTAIGLKKLKDAFSAVTSDTQMLQDFGRLGVLPQQISEQLLLAAEAQGGFGSVMKKYGGDAKLFGQGMLKSTQELNMFATAIGANSQLMQQEAAKASKRASDQIFLNSLNAGEKMTYQYLQAMTGNAETSLQIMRSMKRGITSQEAGLFLSTKGITGMGNEIQNFMDLVSKGSKPLDALTKSGLMSFAKNMSDEKLQRLSDEEYAQRISGNNQLADLMNYQLNLIRTLRDADPKEIENQVKKLSSSLDPDKTGTTDLFVSLQNEQVKLAKSTAALNTQINRLGLSIASGMMKSTNASIGFAGRNKDEAKKFINNYLKSYGLDIEVPDNVLDMANDKIEEWILKKLETGVDAVTASTGAVTAGTFTAAKGDKLVAKNLKHQAQTYSLQDLINDEKLRATTEAFKGPSNRAGTLITGSMLQKQIPTLGVITAGDDQSSAHKATGKHPKGLALDFGVKVGKGQDPEAVYKDTIAAMETVLERDLKLSKGDYTIINERTTGTGPHIHFQFKDEKVADKVRDFYQSQLKAAEETPKEKTADNTTDAGADKKAADAKTSQPMVGTVNNNMAVASTKPEWVDEALAENRSALKLMTADLGNKFDNMYEMLKRKIG